MKKIIPWLVLVVFVGWFLFQFAVTPWRDIPGKIVYKTNRLPVNNGTATMIMEKGEAREIHRGGGLYDYKWSPNGDGVAAFSGYRENGVLKATVVLLDFEGKIIRSIEQPPDRFGAGLAWLPDGKRVLTIEHSGSIWDGALPQQLFIYDLSSEERIPFYVKNVFSFRDISISKTGEIFFTGHPAGKEHLGKGTTLYRMDHDTKKITLLTRGPRQIELVDSDRKIVFYGSLRIFGKLISPSVLGVYDLKTGFTRYISLWAGDIRQMTVVEDGKYLVTAEGEGKAVVLYKRSLLGGFKRPIMKPEKLAHLNGFPSQDQYPDWHA